LISVHKFQCCLRLPTVLSLSCSSSAVCVSVHVTCADSDVWLFLPVANPAVTQQGDVGSGAQLSEVREEVFHILGLLVFVIGSSHSSEVCHRGFSQKNGC